MRTLTMTTIKALVEADVPRSKAERDALLTALGLNQNEQATDPGESLLSFTETARRLSCTRRTLHNMVARGGLTKVRFPHTTKARGFLASEVNRLLMDSVKVGGAA